MFVSIFNNHQFRLWLMGLCAFVWLAFAPNAFAQEPERTADEQSIEDALNAVRDGDFQTGLAMLRAMSEQANPEAMFHLAEMARLGVGGETSMPIATMYYRLAGKLGHERAAMKLANILYFEGSRSPAEIAEAFATWQSYALSGNPEAAYLLGIIYWNGENGRTADPVRGYGLVWRAAQENYADAVSAELEMRTLLPGDARKAGQTYGENLVEYGFSEELLNMDLLIEDWEAAEEEDTDLKKPEDWTAVWHLEVGFALREEDARTMLADILENHSDVVKNLFNEMVPSPNRIDRYKILFGPLDGLHAAVNLCVDFKRAGFDCFAKPPGQAEGE